MTNRDDVLDDFAIEPELSHAVLKVYLSKYPELSDDLLELFHDLTLSDKLLSVEGLTRRANAGNVITFQSETAVQRHWADRTDTFHPRIIIRLELGEPPKEINLIE